MPQFGQNLAPAAISVPQLAPAMAKWRVCRQRRAERDPDWFWSATAEGGTADAIRRAPQPTQADTLARLGSQAASTPTRLVADRSDVPPTDSR